MVQEDPVIYLVPIENSDSKSEEVSKYVSKRRREPRGENERFNESQKNSKKPLVKKVKKVIARKKRKFEVSLVKGPGPSVKSDGTDMTREERVEKMKLQNVLNSQVFAKDILTDHGMGALVDSVTIQEWGHFFEPPLSYLHELEVHEFYYKMDLLVEGSIFTSVKRVSISLNEEILGIIFDVPTIEYDLL